MTEKQKQELRKCLPDGQSMSEEEIEAMGVTLRRWAELVVQVWDRENQKKLAIKKEPLRKEAL